MLLVAFYDTSCWLLFAESTKRNCDICGTNLVPYPLSTERDCGDPNYFSFLCNTSTGLVSFKAPNQIYLVTRINPNTRSFIVQLKAADTYQRNLNGGFELNQSLPFRFSGLPNADLGNYSIDTSSIFIDEVEIGWEPPEEPTCSSPSDCKDWPHSTCNLTVNGERRCLCEKTFRWDGIALNCTQGKNLMLINLEKFMMYALLTLTFSMYTKHWLSK